MPAGSSMPPLLGHQTHEDVRGAGGDDAIVHVAEGPDERLWRLAVHVAAPGVPVAVHLVAETQEKRLAPGSCVLAELVDVGVELARQDPGVGHGGHAPVPPRLPGDVGDVARLPERVARARGEGGRPVDVPHHHRGLSARLSLDRVQLREASLRDAVEEPEVAGLERGAVRTRWVRANDVRVRQVAGEPRARLDRRRLGARGLRPAAGTREQQRSSQTERRCGVCACHTVRRISRSRRARLAAALRPPAIEKGVAEATPVRRHERSTGGCGAALPRTRNY